MTTNINSKGEPAPDRCNNTFAPCFSFPARPLANVRPSRFVCSVGADAQAVVSFVFVDTAVKKQEFFVKAILEHYD
jgi:hypothetical protein